MNADRQYQAQALPFYLHDAEELVEQLNSYIVMRVRRAMEHNPAFAHAATLDLDIDEVAQRVRIKLWQAAQRQFLHSPRAYIAHIISTILVDLLRSRAPTTSLALDDEGEPYQGDPLIEFSQDTEDPSEKVEQDSRLHEFITRLREALLQLPSKQRYVILLILRDRVDNLAVLEELLAGTAYQHTDLVWPEQVKQRQQLLALSAIAKRRLLSLLDLSAPTSKPPLGNTTQQHPEQPAGMDAMPPVAQDTQQENQPEGNQASSQRLDEAPLHQATIDRTQVERLPEPYRTAIQLRYLDGLSYEVMATRLQLPAGTLRTRVSRGLKLLQAAPAQPKTEQAGTAKTRLPQEAPEEMRTALASLREPYRTPLQLHYLEHLTYPQMAQQLQLPVGTLKSLVSRGRKLLHSSCGTTPPKPGTGEPR